jgi:hypothetical protein
VSEVGESKMDSTKVDLQRLKAVVCRLIDEVVKQTGSTIFQLPEADFYWIIPDEIKMVDTGDKKPDDFTVGRLRDDWDLTRSIANVPVDELLSPYSLTEVAPLLDYIGHYVVARGS